MCCEQTLRSYNAGEIVFESGDQTDTFLHVLRFGNEHRCFCINESIVIHRFFGLNLTAAVMFALMCSLFWSCVHCGRGSVCLSEALDSEQGDVTKLAGQVQCRYRNAIASVSTVTIL